MSKPDRETQLRVGEQRLQAWGLSNAADVAALCAVMGRDPAADVAIAARLGAVAGAASVAALQALDSASRDKLVHKEVRRSLYRLEQRGVDIPRATAAPSTVIAAPSLEGYLSPIDGRGDQLVWLTKARPGGVAHLFAVINDPDGLREVELFDTTRKALKASREELLSRHELRLIEADWRYCDYVIDRALQWATQKGHPVTGDYRGLRARLVKEPVQPMQPLILGLLDVDALRQDVRLVAESAKVLEEKELRTWIFEPETLRPYLDEVQRARESPLVLNPAQQEERVRAVTARAVEELFGGEHQGSWVRRLEELAYFFHATQRIELAKLALAAALALERSTHGGREIAFCETMAHASLALFMKLEEERQEEEARGSLVVTPQQALREAQRRR